MLIGGLVSYWWQDLKLQCPEGVLFKARLHVSLREHTIAGEQVDETSVLNAQRFSKLTVCV